MVISMDRWVGKVAIVTGASAGIGAEIAKKLVENGMIVAGLARRKEKIQKLSDSLQKSSGQLHAVRCDVSKEDEILKAFKWVTDHLGPVHVLVNNAGIVRNTTLAEGDTEKWKNVLDTNVLGLCITTREAIRIMKSNNINGHIVQLNSIVGHYLPAYFTHLNIYVATKHAVTALSECLRLELAEQDSGIKVTSISPGITESEVFEASGFPIPDQKMLKCEDVADSIVYALSTPPHVQVKELIIKPVGEPF